MIKALAPYGLLTVLTLVFFAPLVLHPTQTLYTEHSDTLAEHIPAKHFLVTSFQATGEIPLWCPYLFSGSPFVPDIQVAIFYPPHLPLLWLPEQHIGMVLSWLVVAHLLLAGWGMYAYARTQNLGQLGALVAAVGFMFAPKWLAHLIAAGHYILIGLAWLPWILLTLERAIEKTSLLSATIAGVLFGLMVLGTQPQWTFYAGLFIAVWTLGPALQQAGALDPVSQPRPLLRVLACWAGFGLWTALLGILLASIQLLPTMEAARFSTRANGVAVHETLLGSLRPILLFFGPTLIPNPWNLAWEDRGCMAVTWFAAALVAPWFGSRRVRFQAGVTALMLFAATVGVILLQALPGFSLFRQHPRILVVASFPLALLAGTTTDLLFAGAERTVEQRLRVRRTFMLIAVAALILCGGIVLRERAKHAEVLFHPYWVVVPITFLLALILTQLTPVKPWFGWVWGVLLCAELFAFSAPLVDVCSEEELFAPAQSVLYLAEHAGHGRVLDIAPDKEGPETIGTPLGEGVPQALLHQIEAVKGYSPLDLLIYREYLQMMGGQDKPLRAIDGIYTFPILGNVPIKDRGLLDLLGTKYLLLPAEAGSPGASWREVERDEHPFAFNFLQGGGRAPLRPYVIYENLQVFPRAFVVPSACPAPPRAEMLSAMANTDFHALVLLQGYEENAPRGDATLPFRTAEIVSYRPNRVVLRAAGDQPGFLVLTDPWYPGWKCALDGQDTKVYRANHLFRAVVLPAGSHEVTFTFEPAPYRLGERITLATLGLVGLLLAVLLVLRRIRPAPVPRETAP